MACLLNTLLTIYLEFFCPCFGVSAVSVRALPSHSFCDRGRRVSGLAWHSSCRQMPTMASDAMATPAGPSVLERATRILREIQSGDSKPARVALKSLSIFTGVFLIIAGIFGTTELFKSLVYFVGSLYAIIFGLIVLVIELYKLTDSLPALIKTLSAPIKRVYDLIDIYIKFLTLQRGKGLFYCGVGVLVFFIGTGDGGWGLNNAAAMLLFIDGGIHTCVALSYRRPTPPHPKAVVRDDYCPGYG